MRREDGEDRAGAVAAPEAVLRFWLDEVGPERWYKSDAALDRRIGREFAATWERALAGGLRDWGAKPEEALAYLVVTDQFPRNMFRDDARAFATDGAARAAAKQAIARGQDRAVAEPGRQFFYLPLMHAESLADQDRCVRLIAMRMPETGGYSLFSARVHREVIRRFGRFPYRNAALGRRTTHAETAFLSGGGYGAVVRELQRPG